MHGHKNLKLGRYEVAKMEFGQTEGIIRVYIWIIIVIIMFLKS